MMTRDTFKADFTFKDPDAGRQVFDMLMRAASPAMTLLGMPVRFTDYLEPGDWMIGADGALGVGGAVVHCHPTVFYELEATAGEPRPLSLARSVEVKVAASIRWQQEMIARAALRAEQHLDLVMAQQDVRRARAAQAVTLRDELWQAMMDAHPGEEHAWRLDALRQVLACRVCGSRVTAEMAVRLGIEIPKGPQLQVLIDDEWHEVRGVGELSLSFEVDTSAFDRAMGAR